MSFPVVFANLAAGNQPASYFDTMFNVTGQQGNIPCTASGTNAITLTPNTNYYLPASYTNAQIASFKAVATSSGAVTVQIGGLALVKLFTGAGVQANSGDVVLNTHYAVQYWGDLDSGAGGFIILNATVTAVANPVVSSFSKLRIANGGVPNNQVAVSANGIVVQNASGGTTRLTTVSVTISTLTTGANGLDTGTVAASSFYAAFVIFNPGTSTTAGLLSLSETNPALPSGYTYSARVGVVATDGSANLMRSIQLGKRFQYVVSASVTTAYPPIGTTTSATLASMSVTTTVPTSNSIAVIHLFAGNSTTGTIAISPNNLTSPTSLTVNPSPLAVSSGISLAGSFILEAAAIYAATSTGTLSVFCVGWEDNL